MNTQHERQYTYNVTLRGVRVAVLPRARVTLLTQHAKRMRRIILSYVARLAEPNFGTLSQKWHDYRGKAMEHPNVL